MRSFLRAATWRLAIAAVVIAAIKLLGHYWTEIMGIFG